MLDFLFFLPGRSFRPIGGYKVIFEYANTLVKMGYKVGIIYIDNLSTTKRIRKVRTILAQGVKYILNSKRKFWFDIDQRIKIYYQPVFNLNNVPASRVVVASAWNTAYAVSQLGGDYLKKYYLIQGYEVWSASADTLLETYSLGLGNIAISKWLQSIVVDAGNMCDYLPNGLDHDTYYPDHSLIPYAKSRAITLYHPEKDKGFFDVLDVCSLVRRAHPDFKLFIFGAYKKPDNLPDWVEYFYLPPVDLLRGLYSSSAVFISASRSEGWGLTACEAMQCGCAVCLTNIDGYREFAIDGINSLLSEPGDINSMANNIIELLENNEKRYRIVSQGILSMRKYNWDISTKELLRIVGF